jgi:hypothetical protein
MLVCDSESTAVVMFVFLPCRSYYVACCAAQQTAPRHPAVLVDAGPCMCFSHIRHIIGQVMISTAVLNMVFIFGIIRYCLPKPGRCRH